ncbi:MAG: thioredoxin domain-containing protein [bacterium]
MKQSRSPMYYRIGIIVVLVLVVVIVFKSASTGKETAEDLAEIPGYAEESLAWHSLPKEKIDAESLNTEPELVNKKSGTVESKPPSNKGTLAVVNSEKITLELFNQQFESLPPQNKEYFKGDKAGFLEELIVRQLLLQDAKREKIHELPEYKTAIVQNPNQTEEIIINLLIKQIIADVSVTESELKEFFEQSKNQLPNKDYESVKEQLRPMAQEEKQRLAIEAYINKLKSNAQITRNEKWIKMQEALAADNPLNKALKRGQPVVADFGKGTCMPCKMMEPILKKLAEEYEGRASILILDVDEYRSLSRKYRVMMIPTQIFFDSDGKEVYRHQGFMSETDIIAKLKEMGVD